MSPDSRSQSEVVGVVLLIGVVVTVVFTASAFIIPTVLSGTDTPLVSIDVQATTQDITVSHTGGASVNTDDVEVILSGDETERYDLSSFTQTRGSDSSTFERGDRWTRSHGIDTDRMEILLIHKPTNTVVRKTVDITDTIAPRFDWNTTNPTTLDTIEFDASESSYEDGEIVGYEWEIVDEDENFETSEGVTVTHSFSEAGTYEIAMTIQTDDDRTATRTRTIEVFNPALDAEFTFAPENPEPGEAVAFDASASEAPDGEIVSYEWDFGDGNTASGEEVTHSYEDAGNYTVTLEVTDDEGESVSKAQGIVVGGDDPFFEVIGIDPQDPVTEGEELDVELTIENTGDADGEKTVQLDVDADQDGVFEEAVDSEEVELDVDEQTTITLSYETQEGEERPDGDAPEVDVRVTTEDDERTASARVELEPGPVNFVAEDIGTEANEQEFSFDTTELDEEAEIDLSSVEGVDYTGENIQVELVDGGNDNVEYDEDTQIITYSVQGNPSSDRMTVRITGIEVLGEATDFELVEYSDDGGNDDADYFQILGPFLDVELVDTNEPVVEGETLSIDVEVTNVGEEVGDQTLTLDIADTQRDTESVSLDPGESETITLEWDTEESDAGTYTAAVSSEDASDDQSVTITERTQESLEFEIDGQSGLTTIEEGETVDYTATAIFNDESEEDVTDEVSVSAADDGIVSIDTEANQITGDSSGTTTVTATHDSEDGEFQDSVDVSVANIEFIVDSFESPDTVEQDEDISGEVSATIENEGTDEGTQTVELRLGPDVDGTEGDDYEVISSEEVTIAPSDTEEVTFDDAQVPTDADPGEQEIAVFTEDDSETNVITVREVVDLELSANETDILEGETVEFTVTDGDGDPIDDADVEITDEDGNEVITLQTDEGGMATYTFEDEGEYDAVASKDDEENTVFAESEEVTITVTEPTQPSFVENEQTAEAEGGNNPDGVTFEFEVDDPDSQDFQIKFEVEDEGGVSSVGPLTTPESPQTVDEDDGNAFTVNFQSGGELDVTIALFDSDGNEIESCEGTITEADEQIILC